jgi:hypothetical protein
MADVIDSEGMIAMLRPFSPLRRVLLAATGTLQGTLSAFWASPVSVRLLSQEPDPDLEHVRREVDLVCEGLDLVVCHADTTIHVTDHAVDTLLRESSLGIGQIISILGRRTTFSLQDVGQDDVHFWRSYRMWGEGFDYHITESFEQRLYPDVELVELDRDPA